MKLRDIDGNTVYPTILDNRGNNVIDSIKGIKSQITTIQSQINTLSSQKNEISSIETQITKINDDIEYLTEWTSGNTADGTIQILTYGPLGKPLIEIVSGGYWTRAAVTYVNLSIRCISGDWLSDKQVCSGFPQPVIETALMIYDVPFNVSRAKIDAYGRLVLGPDFAEGTIFNIAGCYANKYA